MTKAYAETMEKLDSKLDVVWQWNYEIDIHKLRDLYSKAKKQQWDAESRLNWDVEIDPGADIMDDERMVIQTTKFWKTLSKKQTESYKAHNAAFMLSQFLHGEQGALMVAAALVHGVPDYEAKLYAATQAMDEARHVEVFDRYIKKLDKIYPIGIGLKKVLDATLTHKNWAAMLVGMQMIVEGLALGAFINMLKATKEPLFKDLLTYVKQDEARHVAYGNVYLKEAIQKMHPDDLAEIEDFALDALRMMRQNGVAGRDDGYNQVLIDSDIDPKDFSTAIAKEYMEGWRAKAIPGQVHSFKDLMMPQLVGVGLISSDRIKKKYAEAKVTIYDDATVLQNLTEVHTL